LRSIHYSRLGEDVQQTQKILQAGELGTTEGDEKMNFINSISSNTLLHHQDSIDTFFTAISGSDESLEFFSCKDSIFNTNSQRISFMNESLRSSIYSEKRQSSSSGKTIHSIDSRAMNRDMIRGLVTRIKNHPFL
jgi:hypothetical protein